jgi:hypothetical protein
VCCQLTVFRLRHCRQADALHGSRAAELEGEDEEAGGEDEEFGEEEEEDVEVQAADDDDDPYEDESEL